MTYHYDPAGTRCTGAPAPGMVALRSVALSAFGVADLGIYACRSVRGGAGLSVHGEGRAWDAGVPEGDRVPVDALVAWLVASADELGVQLVIWQRRQWGGRHGPSWASYTQHDPHTGHAHIELTRAAARSLTRAAVRALLPGGDIVTEPLTAEERQQLRDMLKSWGPFADAVAEGADHEQDPSLFQLLTDLGTRIRRIERKVGAEDIEP